MAYIAEHQFSLFDEPEPDFPEEVINKILCRGSGFEGDTRRIRLYFTQAGIHTDKERAGFLKHEYGIGGMHPIHELPNGDRFGVDYDGRGIKITRYNLSKAESKEMFMPWETVQKRIRALIKEGKYVESH